MAMNAGSARRDPGRAAARREYRHGGAGDAELRPHRSASRRTRAIRFPNEAPSAPPGRRLGDHAAGADLRQHRRGGRRSHLSSMRPPRANAKMVKPILTPRAVAARRRWRRAGPARKVGLLFGAERTGLEKDDIALADAVVTVPLNPEFTSAQPRAGGAAGRLRVVPGGRQHAAVADAETNGAEPATKEELYAFFAHFENALDECGFLPQRGGAAEHGPQPAQHVGRGPN